MKVIVNRKSLADAFSEAARVAPTKTPKPVLQNVRIDAGPNGDGKECLSVLGTNLELGVQRRIHEDMTIERSGSLLIPADKMNSLLRVSNDDSVSIEVNEKQIVTVRFSKGKFDMPTQSPEDFPAMPTPKPKEKFCRVVVDAETLRGLFQNTLAACNEDDGRYALNGLLVELEGTKITVGGCDGHQLFIATGECDEVTGESPDQESPGQIIIPSKTVQAIVHALPEEGNVTLDVHESWVKVESDDAVVYGQMIAGRWPDWRKALEATMKFDANYTATVNVAEFERALRQAAVFTGKESQGVDFTFDGVSIKLAGSVSDLGASDVHLDANDANGQASTTMNPQYMLNFLRPLEKGASVSIRVVDDNVATHLSVGEDYYGIIMPLTRR